MSTKLGEWLKLATKEQREELARRSGTSVGYLRLLGYGVRENPKIRLAVGIADATCDINRENPRLPIVGIDDLAEVPVRKGES